MNFSSSLARVSVRCWAAGPGAGPQEPRGLQPGLARGASQDRQKPRRKLPRTGFDKPREGEDETDPASAGDEARGRRTFWDVGKPWGQGRRPDAKAAATTRSAPGQGPLGAGRDSCSPSPPGPQRDKPRGACSSVALPRPQRRLHGQARRRTPRPLTWSAAEAATADEKAGRCGT